MNTTSDVTALLDQFRAARREFQRLYALVPETRHTTPPTPGEWSAREIVAHVAAWIEEANDRIPRLLLGTPPVPYVVDEFNARAIAHAAGWSADQALGAFRRAADRYEIIVIESDPVEFAECEDVMRWLRSMAREVMTEHYTDLERLAAQ